MNLKNNSVCLLICVAGLAIAAALNVSAQSTAFTYQGHLTDSGAPANGTYDLQFGLLDAAVNGNAVANSVVLPAVGVTNGVFTVTLNFGGVAFSGANRWLEISVRTNGSAGAYIELAPRQAVTSTPYAIQALNAQAAQTAPFSGLSGLPVVLGNNTIGSVGSGPLEFYVSGERALRLEPNSFGAVNVIGGASGNYVDPNVFGATISGGGAVNYDYVPMATSNAITASFAAIGGGSGNSILSLSDHSTIGGGFNNTIQNNSSYSAIGGGEQNTILSISSRSTIAGGSGNSISASESAIGGGGHNGINSGAYDSVICGGYYNRILSNAYSSIIVGGEANTIQGGGSASTIGGGSENVIQTNNFNSTIGGGIANSIQVNAVYSTISGGSRNTIQSRAFYATIPGGSQNIAGGEYSFAAGLNSRATNAGAFVWTDSTGLPFGSTGSNQFLVRATGGVGINKNNPATALDVNGTITATAFNGPIVGAASAATNLLGGLSGDVTGTQGATVVSSVGGQSAASVAGSVNTVNAATSALAGNAIVRRDASGSFVARTITAINFSGNGSNLQNLNASQLTGGTVPEAALGNAWQLGGNSSTVPGDQFIGTADNQPLEFKVNGGRALRLEPNTDTGAPNVIGGSSVNIVDAGVVGATIGGGGAISFSPIGMGGTNQVSADFGTVAGGLANRIETNASSATIGGGFANTIELGAYNSTIGGGSYNMVQSNASFSTIGGGIANTIQTNAYLSTIGGGEQNTIQTNAWWSAIGGGWYNTIQVSAYNSTVGGGYYNTIESHAGFSTIGGGAQNTVATNANLSVIGGGSFNTVETNASASTIGGGQNNTVQTNAFYSVIGGGFYNTVQFSAPGCVIGGGADNLIEDNAFTSAISGGTNNLIQEAASNAWIGGGAGNTIQTNGQYAVIPGGFQNSATNFAFAAGFNACATNTGAFVWSDSTGTLTASAASNSVTMRASGGFVFLTDTNSGGASLPAGGTSWATISDRNAKKNFQPVDGAGVLEKLASIPVQHWNYKWEADDAVPHLGPVAQDFKAAFYPGRDDKSITTLEFDGVELAAIQGLNQKVEAQKAELMAKQARIESLEKRLENLEKLVQAMVK